MKKMNLNYYHLCSDGMKTDIMFRDEADYRSAMNVIAIATFQCRIQVLAFCIMSNHFHFVLRASEELVERFAYEINKCLSVRWAKSIDYADPCMEKIRWNRYLLDSQKRLLATIAYVMRNPMVAFYTSIIYDYEWSTLPLYFRDQRVMERFYAMCRRVSSYRVNDVRKLLNTRIQLPADWLITPMGYVWPGSYVDWRLVQDEFRTARNFLYYLFYVKNDDTAEILSHKSRICITDKEMRVKVHSASEKLYGHDNIRDLTLNQRKRIAELINAEFGTGYKQLNRLLHIEME